MSDYSKAIAYYHNRVRSAFAELNIGNRLHAAYLIFGYSLQLLKTVNVNFFTVSDVLFWYAETGELL